DTLRAGEVTSVLVMAADEFGNPAAGSTISLRETSGNITFPRGATCVLDSWGECEIEVRATVPGTFTIEAQLDGEPAPGGNVQVTYVPGPADPAASQLTLGAADSTVGKTVTATAAITDAFGNAVPGVTVSFGVDGDASFVGADGSPVTSCDTGDDGRCQVDVTSRVPGAVSVSAQVDGADVAGSPRSVVFMPGCVPGVDAGCAYDAAVADGARTRVAVTTDNQLAGGPEPNVATVWLTDLYGNPVDRAVTSVSEDPALVVGPAVRVAPGVFTIAYESLATQTSVVQASVLVDGTALAAPVTMRFVVAPVAPVITGPADGALTNARPVVVTGSGQPGAGVVVSDGTGSMLGETVVDANGAWSVAIDLADGTYRLRAVQADAWGYVSPSSLVVEVTVDTVAPDAPVITGPADSALTNARPVVVTGTGEPGATVVVFGLTRIAGVETVVDGDGTWSCAINLADGWHELRAVQTDRAGNGSETSEPVGLTVDTVAPGAPRIDRLDRTGVSGGPGAAEPGATVTVMWPDGSTSTTVVANDGSWFAPLPPGMVSGDVGAFVTDAAGNVSAITDPPLDLDPPDAPRIDAADGTGVSGGAGSGEPGATITVTWPDGSTSTTEVAADGSWSVATPPGMGPGDVTITATDAAGNISLVTTVTLPPGTDEPGTDQPGTDQPGTDQPGSAKPGTDEPAKDQPGMDEPGTDGSDAAETGREQEASRPVAPAGGAVVRHHAELVVLTLTLLLAGGILVWHLGRRSEVPVA
ncbi:MAG: Ig-like domain-containing protein, partial [Actinomycetia bacterium]|nr:Ig-like domain-containing protein [Actinomycetes bacterium]